MSYNEKPVITNYYYNCVFGQPFIINNKSNDNIQNNNIEGPNDIPEEVEKEYMQMINHISKKLNAVPSLVELIIQEYEEYNQK